MYSSNIYSPRNNISLSVSEQILQFYYTQEVSAYMLIVFGVIGVIGNLIILIVYWRLIKMTTTQFLIFLIAIFDFLTALIAIPMVVIYKLFWFEIFNSFYCKICVGTVGFCYLIGSLLLFLVTVVRYCHVCYPEALCFIEPRIKGLCVSIVSTGLFYTLLDIILAKLNKTSNHCNIDVYRLNIGMKIIFFSRFLIIAGVMCVLVVLNILMIQKNYQEKNLKLKSNTGEKPSSSAVHASYESSKEERYLNTIDQLFHLFNETMNTASDALSSVYDGSDVTSVQSVRTNKSIVTVSSERSNKTVNSGKSKSNDDSTSTCSNIDERTTKKKTSKSKKRKKKERTRNIRYGNISTTSDTNTDKGSVSQVAADNGGMVDMTGLAHWDDNRTDSGTCVDPKPIIAECESDDSFSGFSRTHVMLLLVNVVYILSYLPLVVYAMYHVSTRVTTSLETRRYITYPFTNMFFLSCAFNPIIYTFVNASFRHKCAALLKKE